MKKKFCPDCGKEIDRRSERCQRCATKKQWQNLKFRKVQSKAREGNKNVLGYKWTKEQRERKSGKRRSIKTKEKIRRKMTGANNPLYIDGRSYLSPSFISSGFEHKQWAKKIRKKDGYICQVCGNRGWIAHHIDYNKDNFDLDNGVCLCVSCHSKTNTNRDYWKNLFQLIVNKMEIGNVEKVCQV